jgi:FlaG/FlaF family flagellin (archaellin)
MIQKREQGVSPIVGLLLLLGLSVTLFALASNIFFSTLSVSSSPQAELDITHTYTSGVEADVSVRIVRNLNVKDMQYFVEGEDNAVKFSGDFDSNEPGHVQTIGAVDENFTVVITGSVGSDSFVLNTYTVPDESI